MRQEVQADGSQRGVALITALIVVALATTAAVGLTLNQQMGMRRAENMFSRDQAWQYLQGAEAWASIILVQDAKDSQTDHLDEAWAQELPPLPVEGGSITGSLTDLNRFINLNAIVTNEGKISAVDIEHLQRLTESLELPRELLDPLVDWIDKDDDPFSNTGAEESYYLSLPKPYRSANTKLVSVSELHLLKDIENKSYAAIAPFVTVLPENAPLNVNTMPVEVLVALGIPVQATEELINGRPYEAVENFVNLESVKATGMQADGFSVASNYFLLTATARIGRASLTQYSVLKRDNGKVTVVAHSLGTQ